MSNSELRTALQQGIQSEGCYTPCLVLHLDTEKEGCSCTDQHIIQRDGLCVLLLA